MSEYLNPCVDVRANMVSVLGLAHVGDAVFELMVRTWLCVNGVATAKRLHSEAVTFVSAKAQAAAAERIIGVLSEEEMSMFKRGRNSHVNSTPQGASLEEYHLATGMETLFGYLYLSGCTARLDELFRMIVEPGETPA